MTIDGKQVDMRTSAHSAGSPSKMWKIDYKHGVSNSIIVEAETEAEARKIGVAEARKNSGFSGSLCNWTDDVIIDSALCIKDFSEEAVQ